MEKPHAAIRPMPPRNPHEAHRAATPLELLFDLVAVIAIAAAAAALHHSIAAGHAAEGVPHYLMAFFAIWWAWMNFTWFASAYDNDDAPYRLLTMVMMGGALLIAAGIKPFFERFDIGLVVGGYVVMRLGLVPLWLRAARHDPDRRRTTLRYAGGIALAQAYWIGLFLLFTPDTMAFPLLVLLGFAIELAVPAFAERTAQTPWHRHHIIERYGLLTIIVLVDVVTGHASITLAAGDMAVSLPLASYMLGLWFVHDRLVLRGIARWVLPCFALLIATLPLAFPALEAIAALLVISVFARSTLHQASASEAKQSHA